MTLSLLFLFIPPWLHLFFFLKGTSSSACSFRICISQDSVLSLDSQSAHFSYVDAFNLTAFHLTAQVEDASFLCLPLQQPPDWSSCIHSHPIRAIFYPLPECQFKAVVPNLYWVSDSLGGLTKIQLARPHSWSFHLEVSCGIRKSAFLCSQVMLKLLF